MLDADQVPADRMTDNGSAPAPQPMSEEQLRQLAQQDLMVSATFARIVSIMMRSPQYKHLALTDLEWLVVPPLLLGQFAILDGKIDGAPLPVPVAVALWANVSAEVDQRLSTDLAAPMRLRPDEWRSGETVWLIEVIGDPKAVPHLMAQLREKVMAGKQIKMRVIGVDGLATLANL